MVLFVCLFVHCLFVCSKMAFPSPSRNECNVKFPDLGMAGEHSQLLPQPFGEE